MYLAQAIPAAPLLPPAEDAAQAAPPGAVQTFYEALYRAFDSVMPSIVAVILARLVMVAIVLAAGWVALRVARFLITRAGRGLLIARLGAASRPRIVSVTTLFYSIAKYVVYFVVFVAALKQIGADPAPFLGGAAIVALAVSFGSQDLVKDFVTGISIMLEDQFTIGEHVELAGKSGTVVAMSIRTVTVLDVNGNLNNIPYRTVTVVTNLSRTTAILNVDVFLAEGAAESAAVKALSDALESVSAELAPFVRSWKVAGVITPGAGRRAVRASLDVAAGRSEFVQGELAERIKAVFAERSLGIAGERVRFFNRPASVE